MTPPPETVIPVITDLMERMYFTSPEFCGDTSCSSDALAVAVNFSGTSSGSLRIAVDRVLARRMTADFLAMEIEAVEEDQMGATVSEFANVACGALLAEWMPNDNFHFSVPHALANWEPVPDSCSFTVLAGRPELAVSLAIGAESSCHQ
jgi:hypothetical protein